MNAARLLAHYERVAEAPDAIARLRRFILDLAVRGKLVPQASDDSPTSELLKLISSERALLVRAKKIRDKAPVADVAANQVPFEIPGSWRWVRFANIADFSAGRTPSRNDLSFWNSGDHAWVSIADMADGHVLTTTKETISEKARERVFASAPEPSGTIIMSFKLTIGKIARLGLPAFHNEAIISIKPYLAGLDGYLFKILPQFARLGDTKGAIKGATLNRDSISNILLPLPPLAEQHRIVAKVDELMALCDQLEASRAAREAARDRLAAASLAPLNTPDPDVFVDSARFALDALPALTSRPDQIMQLRQTILGLAVRGMLLPQDPTDEPATDLMNRLLQDRKHRRKFADINEDELENPLPDLPTNWTWTTVDRIADDQENSITDGPFGSQLKTEHYIDAPGYRVIRLQNIGNGFFRNEHRSFVDQARFNSLSKHHVEPGDLIVAGLVDPRVRCCEVPANSGPALVKADCYRFAVHPELSSRYALYFLNSPLAEEFAAVHNHGMTLTRIGLGNFRRVPVPLPPVAEQHRIVAKVDTLMALCDQLEASLDATAATRRRLLDALLAEALAPVEAREMELA